MTFDDFWWLESALVDFWMRRIQWHKRFVISLHESAWVTFHLMPHWLVETIMQNSRNISITIFSQVHKMWNLQKLVWMWCIFFREFSGSSCKQCKQHAHGSILSKDEETYGWPWLESKSLRGSFFVWVMIHVSLAIFSTLFGGLHCKYSERLEEYPIR